VSSEPAPGTEPDEKQRLLDDLRRIQQIAYAKAVRVLVTQTEDKEAVHA
jgi:hypothetical protein